MCLWCSLEASIGQLNPQGNEKKYPVGIPRKIPHQGQQYWRQKNYSDVPSNNSTRQEELQFEIKFEIPRAGRGDPYARRNWFPREKSHLFSDMTKWRGRRLFNTRKKRYTISNTSVICQRWCILTLYHYSYWNTIRTEFETAISIRSRGWCVHMSRPEWSLNMYELISPILRYSPRLPHRGKSM